MVSKIQLCMIYCLFAVTVICEQDNLLSVHIDLVPAEVVKAELDAQTGLLVINVLNARSYKDCSIPQSVNIPMDTLKRKVKHLKKDQPLIVHCASCECPLSKYAYKDLKELGFTNVRAYEGGLRDWKKQGYPVKGLCKAGYLK